MWWHMKIGQPCLLLLALCFSGIHWSCVAYETQDVINPRGLLSLEWGAQLQGLEGLLLPENLTSPGLSRNKRFINLGKSDEMPNKAYQECIAPGGKQGHCRHLSRCVLEDFRANFARFMDYMCIIERTYVGACCPDGAQVVKVDSSPAESLAGVLPAVADTNEERPVWDDVEQSSNNEDLSSIELNSHNLTDTSSIEQESILVNATRKARKPRGCGTSTKSRTRIVGGRPADPKEWPWMAALLRGNTVQYCGGVLITDRHVLTAAHCVQKYKPRDIKVRLGEYDFTKPDETRSLDFNVIEIRIHRDFNAATYDNDIAIVKIHRPTIFNTYIWPICLPPIDQTFENKSAVVTGWGTQFYGGPASTVLMEVAVPIWPQEKCVRSFTQRISRAVMCAGAYEGGRDACQGDSGGPLLHQLGNGRWVNVGIVSWGIRCGEPGHPGIYTRVNSYLNWIFANAVF